MNRTQIIGITMVVVGMATVSHYQKDNYDEIMMSMGSVLVFIGAFIMWNGWVARVNREPNFALFG